MLQKSVHKLSFQSYETWFIPQSYFIWKQMGFMVWYLGAFSYNIIIMHSIFVINQWHFDEFDSLHMEIYIHKILYGNIFIQTKMDYLNIHNKIVCMLTCNFLLYQKYIHTLQICCFQYLIIHMSLKLKCTTSCFYSFLITRLMVLYESMKDLVDLNN